MVAYLCRLIFFCIIHIFAIFFLEPEEIWKQRLCRMPPLSLPYYPHRWDDITEWYLSDYLISWVDWRKKGSKAYTSTLTKHIKKKSGSDALCNHATQSSAAPRRLDLIHSVGYWQNVIWSSEILHGATSAKSHYCLVFRSASPPPRWSMKAKG